MHNHHCFTTCQAYSGFICPAFGQEKAAASAAVFFKIFKYLFVVPELQIIGSRKVFVVVANLVVQYMLHLFVKFVTRQVAEYARYGALIKHN